MAKVVCGETDNGVELEIDLLTKDEALIQHIKNQGFTKIISLQEFLKQL